MPINLDAADKLFMSAKADTHRPTYFCSELTGGYTVTGKLRNSGTLRPESDPGAFPAGTRKLHRDDIDVYRRTVSNAGTTTYLIPIDLATADMWTRAFDNIELASRDGAIPIAEQTVRLRGTTAKVCAYMTLDAHSVVIEKTKTDSGYVRNARIVWRVSTWFDSCGSTHPATVIHSQPYPAFIPSPNQTLKLCSNVTNAVTVAFVADVPGYLEATLDAFIAVGWTVDAQAAYDALVDIHSYDKIADAADRWQTAIDEDFAKTVDAIVSCVGADQAIRHVHNLVHRLEAYPVPLNLYIKIYNYLKSKFPDYALDEIVESNLNLLMTDTMQRLDDAKSTLETCPVNPQAQASAFFNGGQRAAIESHDPLVMVQSAAGTGKSSTLKGRIQYMVDSGIDPHDITVLSFTNAAADHIRDICPDINSMTISSMVHTIYQENFNHELSSIPTLLNSLDIWFPRGSLASDLKHYLHAVDAHEPDAFTRLNSFVKTNYDGVINLLDGCGQTTLELEIVIAYQKIGTFIEPPEVSSRHLLVDEVQDNSIFDFVYILEYVLKHKESLFIVGRRIADVKPYELRETREYNLLTAA